MTLTERCARLATRHWAKRPWETLKPGTKAAFERGAQAVLDEAREEIAREAVAAWMIAHSYATGHGDTLDDLLQELARCP